MITNTILLICITIFILIQVVDKDPSPTTKAIKYGAFYLPNIEIKQEYWRFITANFVHVDPLHLFFNGYALYYMGSIFEGYFESWQYLYVILFSCLATTGVTYLYARKRPYMANQITLGASGIFYGFLGVIIALGVLFGGVYLQVLRSFMPMIVINVVFTLWNSRVSKTGHLGGFLGGFIATALLIVTGLCTY